MVEAPNILITTLPNVAKVIKHLDKVLFNFDLRYKHKINILK